MNINKKSVGFEQNIKQYCWILHYNINAYPMLIIGYVDVRRIPCSRSSCLRKMNYTWNRRQDN